jgi:predicted small secreted protein
MTKKLVALIALTGFVLVAVGCNTVEGAGKDIKSAGNAVENAAQ